MTADCGVSDARPRHAQPQASPHIQHQMQQLMDMVSMLKQQVRITFKCPTFELNKSIKGHFKLSIISGERTLLFDFLTPTGIKTELIDFVVTFR